MSAFITRRCSPVLACRRLRRGGAPIGHGELPPATERAVEGDDGDELVALRAREIELGGKELLLGFEDLEVGRDAVVVALERQRDRRLEGLHRLVTGGVHAPELFPGGGRARYLSQRRPRRMLAAFDRLGPRGRTCPLA